MNPPNTEFPGKDSTNMHVHFDTENLGSEDVRALQAMLAVYAGDNVGTKSPPEEEEDKPVAKKPAAKKTDAPARKKPEPEPEPEDEDEDVEDVEDVEVDEDEDEVSDDDYTFEQVKKKASDVVGAGNVAKVRAALKKVGAAKVSEIDEGDYGEFMALLNKA